MTSFAHHAAPRAEAAAPPPPTHGGPAASATQPPGDVGTGTGAGGDGPTPVASAAIAGVSRAPMTGEEGSAPADPAADQPERDDEQEPMGPVFVVAALALALSLILATAIRHPAIHPAAGGDAPAGDAFSAPDMRVDVNRDPAAVIEVLPGVGPVLAERIVSERDTHGPFRSLEDLERVHGIGPKTIESLRGVVAPISPPAQP